MDWLSGRNSICEPGMCVPGKTSADCTLELAAWAGMLGGFVHASQSLVDYMGNRTLHRSWALWYLLRPLQGAVVGAAFYIIARAGLISNAGEVNVYGVSALGLLGGWFSKNASDKMKEVFETLFGKGADASRANKMSDDAGSRMPRLLQVLSDGWNGLSNWFLEFLKQEFSDGVTGRPVPEVLR